MPRRRFRHLGDEWEATGLGTGHGVGFGFIPRISSWAAEFRCVTDPQRGPFQGRIPESDASDVSDDVLRAALEIPVVVDALRQSPDVWRTVESLSDETGVDIERVNRILEWESGEVVQGNLPDSQGRTLYAARDRYAEVTPFMKRYLDVLTS
jgi:hypothetical protein